MSSIRKSIESRNIKLAKAAGSVAKRPAAKKRRTKISQFTDEEMANMTMERYKQLDFN